MNSPADRARRQAIIDAALGSSTDDCILWPFNPNRRYGSHAGKGVHQIVCTSARGPRPAPDLHAAHSCGHTKCINPRHVRWATPFENVVIDRIAQGTFPAAGDDHPRRKVTDAQIVQMITSYRDDRATQVELGRRFCISQGHVSRIIRQRALQ